MVGNGIAYWGGPVKFKLEIHLICDIDIDASKCCNYRGIKCFDYSFTGEHKLSEPGDGGGGEVEKPEDGPVT